MMDHDYCTTRNEAPIKINNTYCCVPQCSNKPTSGQSFHVFPQEAVLRNHWVRLLRIGKKVSNYMKVCSEHFQDTDFFHIGLTSTRKRLKKAAVPSRKLPTVMHSKVQNEKQLAAINKRAARLAGRNTEKAEALNEGVSCQLQNIESNCTAGCSSTGQEVGQESEPLVDDASVTNHEFDAANALLELRNVFAEETSESPETSNTTPFVTATSGSRIAGKKSPTLIDMIQTDDDINAFTGIPSLALLDSISQAAELLQEDTYDCKLQLDITERIVLTMVKLKLNISFKCISVLFGISITTCISYFKLTVALLSSLMETAIVWPSKQDILGNMPTCFAKYKNTRIVLDCTETPVEKPACLKCRLSTYSHYKGCNTIKFMVGVAPEGLITFCSVAYGGRASDKAIYLQSNLMSELIPYSDAIMSDKGFLVEPECLMSGIALIRPPFLGKKKQFSAIDGELTVSIAQARVHVERSIQRLKIFRILKCQLPWSLVGHVDSFIKIAAGLVNLSNPILAMDKF